MAHKGTLFLDEVGETPPPMQVKLLRALQERRIRRVGGTDEFDIDVRVISATNVPLEELIEAKRFREDLFYRLQVIPIKTPPLRQRREDIPLLAEHFLRRFSQEMGKGISKISEQAMELLEKHSWPGNVRELENVIERAVALEPTTAILPERLPETLRSGGGSEARVSELRSGFSLDEHLQAEEKELLHRALTQASGDRTEAAALLGVTARSLRYLIQKHGMPA
jgi:two-component system response regulator PilR (NtrC family)